MSVSRGGTIYHSALYLHKINHNASPKVISGRTSYIPARLVFRPQPQVIKAFFNRPQFGPPSAFTQTSTCSWLARRVSGLQHSTYRSIQTRFRFGSVPLDLTLLNTVTRRFILQKARHQPLTASDYLQAHSFRFYFTPLPGFFSPFLHSTGSLSVTSQYLTL